jgi:hypothetical protein
MPLAPLGQRGRDSTRGVDILAKAGGNDGLGLAYRVPYCRSHGAVSDATSPCMPLPFVGSIEST